MHLSLAILILQAIRKPYRALFFHSLFTITILCVNFLLPSRPSKVFLHLTFFLIYMLILKGGLFSLGKWKALKCGNRSTEVRRIAIYQCLVPNIDSRICVLRLCRQKVTLSLRCKSWISGSRTAASVAITDCAMCM